MLVVCADNDLLFWGWFTENNLADAESRKSRKELEWALDPLVFNTGIQKLVSVQKLSFKENWSTFMHCREWNKFFNFDGGVWYSVINSARSALSSAITHPIVVRFMKGVFEQRSSLPRYTNIWNVEVLLRHLLNLGKPQDISLKTLTHKLVMLMALLSGKRRLTLHALDIDSMQLKSDSCTFVNSKHIPPIRCTCTLHELMCW